MALYTYTTARQKLAKLLDEAKKNKEVLIKRKNGDLFVLKKINGSSKKIKFTGINIPIDREEIVEIVREGREI